jgi:hypothetical protein
MGERMACDENLAVDGETQNRPFISAQERGKVRSTAKKADS